MHSWDAEVEPLLALGVGIFYVCDHSGWLGDGCVPPTQLVSVK